jgi:hypothetical protein
VVSKTEVVHGARSSVIKVLNEIVARKLRWGFWKLYDRLRLGTSLSIDQSSQLSAGRSTDQPAPTTTNLMAATNPFRATLTC